MRGCRSSASGMDVEPRDELHALEQNASTGAPFALFPWDRPAIGIAEPQAQEMTLARLVGPILIFAPRVQRDEIVQELHVTRRKADIDRACLDRIAIEIDGFLLHRR